MKKLTHQPLNENTRKMNNPMINIMIFVLLIIAALTSCSDKKDDPQPQVKIEVAAQTGVNGTLSASGLVGDTVGLWISPKNQEIANAIRSGSKDLFLTITKGGNEAVIGRDVDMLTNLIQFANVYDLTPKAYPLVFQARSAGSYQVRLYHAGELAGVSNTVVINNRTNVIPDTIVYHVRASLGKTNFAVGELANVRLNAYTQIGAAINWTGNTQVTLTGPNTNKTNTVSFTGTNQVFVSNWHQFTSAGTYTLTAQVLPNGRTTSTTITVTDTTSNPGPGPSTGTVTSSTPTYQTNAGDPHPSVIVTIGSTSNGTIVVELERLVGSTWQFVDMSPYSGLNNIIDYQTSMGSIQVQKTVYLPQRSTYRLKYTQGGKVNYSPQFTY